MKVMKRIYKEIELDIKGATLLNCSEFEKLKNNIPFYEDYIAGVVCFSYWLSDRATEDGAVCVYYYYIDEDEQEDEGSWKISNIEGAPIHFSQYVRPVLLFENNTYMSLGDIFKIKETEFTVITDNMAISNYAIDYIPFDKYNTSYEQSYVKQKIDKWFSDLVEPL